MTNIFYINLDRVPERAEFMSAQLEKAGLSDRAERFPAIDARAEGTIDAPGYTPRAWLEYWTLTPSELAIFEGHRRLWQRIVADDLPAAVVLEDDVFMSGDFPNVVKALLDHPHVFDFAKIDGVGGRYRFGPETRLGPVRTRPILQALPSAAAYAVSQSGARKLLEQARRHCDHPDDILTRARLGWNAYQVFPAVAVQGMFTRIEASPDIPSSVTGSERTGPTSRERMAERGPASYRLRKEAARAGRRIAQALWRDRLILAHGGMIGEPPVASDIGPYR